MNGATVFAAPPPRVKYHHARRGGLVEQTAQMMRVAQEIVPLYAELNLDLLLADISHA